MTTTPIAPSATQTQYPDEIGRFGKYGGKYVPETLMPALSELETAYHRYKNAPEFQAELSQLLKDYVGRPSPLYFAERLTEYYAPPDGTGPQIYLKSIGLNNMPLGHVYPLTFSLKSDL